MTHSRAQFEECKQDCCQGGYHGVELGDSLLNRYQVTRKLGWGTFSTVWLCWDFKDNRYVAVKISKSARQITVTAKKEIQILKAVLNGTPNPKRDKIVQMINDFEISDVNGTHICTVLEVLGDNLSTLIKKSKGIPLPNVKSIIRQVLEGLDYLHTECCQIIHTDIKPGNVLICANQQDIREKAVKDKKLPKEIQEQPITGKMTKNQQKEMKEKAKRQPELIKKQLEHIQQLDVTPEMDDSPKNVNVGQKDNDDSNGRENTPRNENSQATNDIANTMKELPDEDEKENDNVSEKLADLIVDDVEENNNTFDEATDIILKDEENNSTSVEDKTKQSGYKLHVHVQPKDPAFEICDIKIKIADLGNVCWFQQHFSTIIQTPQYRCIEVMLNRGYDASADIWSTACMAFELATGDYLFQPDNHEKDEFRRNELYVKQIIDLLKPRSIEPCDRLKKLLRKYEKWSQNEVAAFAEFLLPMLALDPPNRATAAQCLNHPWLKK